ncbi:MAG: UDP-N-acetylglucosamine 1-carboxyvinyltransferase, partial [Bacteroidales bacterium]|nr:UDP-N-acetylglucosamine 1-carboxyvinyltransferase [Bacteroidales bacterium]
MASFEITGGRKLQGEIVPQGAKNEALQVLCAVLLTSEKVRICDVPDIRDVNKLIDLLKLLGVSVRQDVTATTESGRTFEFQADQVNLEVLNSPEYRDQAGTLRGSIMLVGPLLSRFGRAVVPQPGGDKIGRRRLDTHFIGMER